MTTVEHQAEGVISFWKKHPVLGSLLAGGAALVAKKEYDRRYGSGSKDREKSDEED